MHSKKEKPEFRWEIPVYTAWLVIICKSVYTGEYTNFIRPEFVFILILGGVALAVFILTCLFGNNKHHHSKTGLLHAAIMFLPFFYFLNAQDASLGTQAFGKRFSGLPAIENNIMPANSQISESVLPGNELDAYGSMQEGTSSGPDEYYENNPFNDPESIFTGNSGDIPFLDLENSEVTIIDLYDMPRVFLGKDITVTGMLHKDASELTGDLDKDYAILYRFLIVCCAADAIPVAVLLDSNYLQDLNDGDWISVQGKFSLADIDKRSIPVILNSDVEKIQQPEDQYLY